MNKDENKFYYMNPTHLFNVVKKKLKTENIDFSFDELQNFCTDIYNFADKNYTFFKDNKILCPLKFLTEYYNRINIQEEWDELFNNRNEIFNTYNYILDNFYNIDYGIKLLDFYIYCPNIKGFAYGTNSNTKIYGEYINSVFKDLETIRDVSGVYRLYDIDKNLIYIGKSYSLGVRLISSASIQSAIYYDYAVVNNKADTDIYEIFYISKLKPKNNSENNNEDSPTVDLKELKFTEIKPLFDLNIDLTKYKFKYNRNIMKWEKVKIDS